MSCPSSLIRFVPNGNSLFPLSYVFSGESHGFVDSAMNSSVALITFRTSVDMLQREAAEHFCFKDKEWILEKTY